LVSEPAKLSWKNAASRASSSSADHVQVLDSAAVEAVQAVNADPPHDLGE